MASTIRVAETIPCYPLPETQIQSFGHARHSVDTAQEQFVGRRLLPVGLRCAFRRARSVDYSPRSQVGPFLSGTPFSHVWNGSSDGAHICVSSKCRYCMTVLLTKPALHKK